ncbi:nuclear transport factor 2-like protein [Chryseobacterium pennipullorum]|uniref:Nuclear transport factor 2 family protein n=1 Tax=Chryseobacterium pennipullorum TaxID=2258963 RepID=A0A3D9B1A9_9FLAO|nr:nuclear transport factor 2 family protein [Chryseobacterium pennipullorum]REC47435.1 hypothetical protein DRF67_10335 [Chryseobacterium pennipullorum]
MIHFIRQVFTHVLENPVFDESLIEQYFSRDYVQTVDHQQLHYEEFVLHIKKLKEKVAEQHIDIVSYAENGDSIFTRHIAKSFLKDGSYALHQVMAEFTIRDQKIVRCNELTLLLEGNHAEKNLGSEI